MAVGAGVQCPSIELAQFLLTLDDGRRAITYGYGDSLNPSGSLRVIGGQPSIGSTLQVGVDNPLGTQSAGGFPFAVLSLRADANFPGGTSIGGFGMAGGGAVGELLVSLAATDLVPPALFGPAWAGTGQPSVIDITVPSDAGLLGLILFCQGVLPDPSAGPSGVRFGLTEGLQLRIGP